MFFKDKEDPIKSPKFSTPDGSEWYLRLHPLGFQKDVPNRNYISVYLCLYRPPGSETTVYAKHRGKLLPADENIHELLKYMERSATQGKVDCFNKDNFSWGWPEFTSHRDLFDENKKFMKEGHLQVLWYMEILQETVSSSTPAHDIVAPSISIDMERLFKSGDFADFKIRTEDNVVFPVHRALLASRNKYFAGMLMNDTLEAQQGEVLAMDTTSDAMKELLRFIYTDTVSENSIQNMAEELFMAAEKHQVCRLKQLCERELLSRIDADNAPRLLLLGDIYCSDVMKEEAARFILANREDCLSGSGWREMKASSEQHVTRILEDLLKWMPSNK